MDDARNSARAGSRPSLPLPVAAVLHDPVREQSVVRMWHVVEARLRAEAPAGPWKVIGWASLGALVAVLAMFVARGLDRGTTLPVITATEAGPLVTSDGKPLGVVDVPVDGRPSAVALADGSHIVIGADTRLEPLASSGREFIVRLARGRATFDVKPGGPRRWVVEAGVASVEVVGTRFIVVREPSNVRVRVERGIVLVRGATVPDGVTRLEAGETTVVRTASVHPPVVRHDGDGPDDVDVLDPSTLPRARKDARPDDGRAGSNTEDYAHTYDLLGKEGLKVESERAKTADELFALADVARRSGHLADAIVPLQRLVLYYPSNPRAPLASVTLGRILLSLERPAEAGRALEAALSRGVPVGLEEDVYVRLVEALVKAGNPAKAGSMAEAYARRFPNGRRKADIERWLGR
jgi:transmembrane sensor